MPFRLEPATDEDVPELVALRTAAGEELARVFGPGHWTGRSSERGLRFDMTLGRYFVARARGRIIAMLCLGTRKPWAIDPAYFTPVKKPLYLSSMVVHPRRQRKGVGRGCLEEAARLAREWPAEAIRLDAWDAPAGAGGFYARCGYREVGRVVYRQAPLVSFEQLL